MTNWWRNNQIIVAVCLLAVMIFILIWLIYMITGQRSEGNLQIDNTGFVFIEGVGYETLYCGSAEGIWYRKQRVASEHGLWYDVQSELIPDRIPLGMKKCGPVIPDTLVYTVVDIAQDETSGKFVFLHDGGFYRADSIQGPYTLVPTTMDFLWYDWVIHDSLARVWYYETKNEWMSGNKARRDSLLGQEDSGADTHPLPPDSIIYIHPKYIGRTKNGGHLFDTPDGMYICDSIMGTWEKWDMDWNDWDPH